MGTAVCCIAMGRMIELACERSCCTKGSEWIVDNRIGRVNGAAEKRKANTLDLGMEHMPRRPVKRCLHKSGHDYRAPDRQTVFVTRLCLHTQQDCKSEGYKSS